MANNSSIPVVGEGATILMYTDREAYTVREFNPKEKTVVIQRCKPKRIDSLGMSESQTYDYSKHEDTLNTLTYRYHSWYRMYKSPYTEKMQYHKVRIIFGLREEYYDFSF